MSDELRLSACATREFQCGDARIEYSVDRGNRAKARLVVSPQGCIQVRVPHDVPDTWIDAFVTRRRHWIMRQRLYFEQFRPREPNRRFVSGETIRYLGRQYILRVLHTASPNVRMRGRYLDVFVPSHSRAEDIEQAIRGWYRQRALDVFSYRAKLCASLLRPHGVITPPIGVREMRRRWGSCTPLGRILLNPYLVIAPTDCVDYVLVHELCHIRHPCHNEAFYQLLTIVMPDWPRRRKRLERHGPFLSL
jgi:predicted metal-dependent hydrolase